MSSKTIIFVVKFWSPRESFCWLVFVSMDSKFILRFSYYTNFVLELYEIAQLEDNNTIKCAIQVLNP